MRLEHLHRNNSQIYIIKQTQNNKNSANTNINKQKQTLSANNGAETYYLEKKSSLSLQDLEKSTTEVGRKVLLHVYMCMICFIGLYISVFLLDFWFVP